MGVLTAWTAAIVFQTARDVKVNHVPPLPAEFVASGLLFGGLAVLGSAQPRIAGTLAWGFLIALFLASGGLAGGGVPTGTGGAATRTGPKSHKVPTQGKGT